MRYYRRSEAVDAVQYRPPYNCREVWAFLGWEWDRTGRMLSPYHDDEECTKDSPLFLAEGLQVNPREWIVVKPNGGTVTLDPLAFHTAYAAE